MLSAAPHILVIDDNEEMLQVIAMMLSKKHFTVSLKSRFINMHEEVALLQPDLILLDKSLGWANGATLCKELKEAALTAHTPVLMLSAYHKSVDECMAAGASGFIPKPFTLEELIDNIGLALASTFRKAAV